MSMFAALAKRWNYPVTDPGAGRLIYREGNREYTFPLYREDNELVLAAVPSSQRIFLLLNWYAHPHDFSPAARARILPRILKHLSEIGLRVRIFDAPSTDGGFEFFPELVGERARAIQLLAEAGYDWFAEYQSVEACHDDYGLEVCGIPRECDAKAIAEILIRAFPHWHHLNLSLDEQGSEQGWAVSLGMFPASHMTADWRDEE